MHVFVYELRSLRKTIYVWAFSLSLIALVFLAMYPAFTSDVEATRNLFSSLPAPLLAALGIDLNVFFSVVGYYTYILLYILLAGGICAMNLGVAILSKEGREKTADFLLTKPVTRATVVVSKIAAVLVALVGINVIYQLCLYGFARIFAHAPFDGQRFVLLSGILFLSQLLFMAVGLIVSVIIPKIKSVISVSLPIVFGFFIISMLDSVIDIAYLRYFTPFKFFDVHYILAHSAYEGRFVWYTVLIVLGASVATYGIYQRKDIHAGA